MGSIDKISELILALTIASLSGMLPLVYGEASLNTTSETPTPIMIEPAPTPTPLGVISGLIAAVIVTVLLIYMLKRMKAQRPILGL